MVMSSITGLPDFASCRLKVDSHHEEGRSKVRVRPPLRSERGKAREEDNMGGLEERGATPSSRLQLVNRKGGRGVVVSRRKTNTEKIKRGPPTRGGTLLMPNKGASDLRSRLLPRKGSSLKRGSLKKS